MSDNILYLVQLRASAIEQAGKDGYTWMAPSHVLNLLNTIEEQRARVAKLESTLLVDGPKILARNAKLEAALENVAKECGTFPIRDGLAFRCESIARAALKDAPDA